VKHNNSESFNKSINHSKYSQDNLVNIKSNINYKHQPQHKYKRDHKRDDSIELFNSRINHSNCNITKSFDSSMAQDNDYSQQRYETILNSTHDNK